MIIIMVVIIIIKNGFDRGCSADNMKYRKVWVPTIMFDIAGLFLLVGGFYLGGVIGGGLVSLGAVIIVAPFMTNFTMGGAVGMAVGGIVGYFNAEIIGFVLGMAVGGITGGAIGGVMGPWAKKVKASTDVSLKSAKSLLDRSRWETLTKYKEIEVTIRNVGRYHMDPRLCIREFKYVTERIRNIAISYDNPNSMENAAVTYQDIRGELGRIEKEMEPYCASTGWSIEEKRYGVKKGRNDLKIIEPARYGSGKDTDAAEKEANIEPSTDYVKHLEPSKGDPVASKISNYLRKYILVNELGSGNIAHTYSGKAPGGMEIVVKIPNLGKDNSQNMVTLIEFMDQMNRWKDLKHGNIVEVYERDARPTPHVVMERMDGGSLSGLMKKHDLPVEDAVYIMREALKGVSHAQEKGMVHGNLKPGNILFRKNGTVKIGEWGWSKFMSSVDREKFVENNLKAGYCTPEQIDSEEYGGTDMATDIFLLGIIFYEMLTGKNPFHNDNPDEIASNIIRMEVKAPSSVNDKVPKGLDRLVLRALNKRKEDRWGNAKIMMDELRELVGE